MRDEVEDAMLEDGEIVEQLAADVPRMRIRWTPAPAEEGALPFPLEGWVKRRGCFFDPGGGGGGRPGESNPDFGMWGEAPGSASY